MSHRPHFPLGIIGGMSWASTQQYYRQINEAYHQALGKQHSAPLMLASVDFQDVIRFQVKDEWDKAGTLLAQQALALERAGCAAFLIASNTMHKVSAAVTNVTNMHFIDICAATSAALHAANVAKVCLLGTRYTMSDSYFREAYSRHNIEISAPNAHDAHLINSIIFNELIHNRVTRESKTAFLSVVERLKKAGHQAIILGCTELELLCQADELPLPAFDTTAIHCQAATAWILAQRPTD